MKVLFIHYNDYLSYGIPGGIATLSAVLRQAGHQVDIFDTTFIKTKPDIVSDANTQGIFLPTAYTIEDLCKDDPVRSIQDAFDDKLREFSPDLIAVSVMTGFFDDVIELLNKAKPRAKVLIGGVHATICPDDALLPEIVDYICIGEGEEFIVDLCEYMESGKDISGLRNLGYKKNGKMFFNGLRPFANLDNLPTPDWSIFDSRHLFRPFMGKIYKGSFYEMSRGCPMQCAYCVNGSLRERLKSCGNYFRFQSARTTIRHLTELKNLYGATWFKFADDSITYMSENYLKELADGLKPLNIKFGCSIRPESVTKNKIRLLKDAGCVAASVGVESGSPELRKNILNRHMSDEQIETAIDGLKEAGIRISTFNMIGLPGEKREDVFKTIRFNKKLNVEAANVYIIYPYPGTQISIKNKIPLRGSDGRIIPVTKASVFGLSEMSPAELEGLIDTFNLYLKAPEKLWPTIQKAEGNKEELALLRKKSL